MSNSLKIIEQLLAGNLADWMDFDDVNIQLQKIIATERLDELKRAVYVPYNSQAQYYQSRGDELERLIMMKDDTITP